MTAAAKTQQTEVTLYTYTIVGVPSRGWRWAHRAELRVHRVGIEPRGRGYRERCLYIVEDMDARHSGPRSRLGREIERARRLIESQESGVQWYDPRD